jgi:hypothetical protein
MTEPGQIVTRACKGMGLLATEEITGKEGMLPSAQRAESAQNAPVKLLLRRNKAFSAVRLDQLDGRLPARASKCFLGPHITCCTSLEDQCFLC